MFTSTDWSTAPVPSNIVAKHRDVSRTPGRSSHPFTVPSLEYWDMIVVEVDR